MAKSQSKSKDRLIEILILVFVIVTVSMVVAQLAINVLDTIDQSGSASNPGEHHDLPPTPTPSGPTPTIDFGPPIIDA